MVHRTMNGSSYALLVPARARARAQILTKAPVALLVVRACAKKNGRRSARCSDAAIARRRSGRRGLFLLRGLARRRLVGLRRLGGLALHVLGGRLDRGHDLRT